MKVNNDKKKVTKGKMKKFGKAPRRGLRFMLVFMGILTLLSQSVSAAVTAQVDRNRVALGDTLQLTITATDGEDVGDTDLAPLRNYFEVLQRSSSRNISIVNGKRTNTKQLVLEIAPVKEGALMIPALRIGSTTTQAIQVLVSPTPDVKTDGQNVFFEAEVDSENVYVQSQILLTLRIHQSINLDARNISELEIDHAFVKPLEQKSFQRNINGRDWLVHEIRYAIFPEQSGTLTIPAQVFSGRLREGRRSFFNQSSGRRMQRSTQALTIDVKPRPTEFTGDTWLPARQVKIEERWSTPPEQLRAGESATRTIRIVGEGLQGAQLPPILFTPAEGMKFYPDQPDISEQEVSSGLLGARQDSTAVVPTREGSWTVPEIRIAWWDTQSEQERYAVLPGRTLDVAAADPTSAPATTALPGPAQASALSAASGNGNALVWQLISAVSLGGWLLTLLYLWRNRSPKTAQEVPGDENPSERRAFKQLQSVLSTQDANGTRKALITWANALPGQGAVASLEQVAALFADKPLTTELEKLDAHIYGSLAQTWQSSDLMACVDRLREEHRKQSKQKPTATLELYPQAG